MPQLMDARQIEAWVTPRPQPVRVRVMRTSDAADLWLGELNRQGKAPRTVASYRRLLDKLADMYPYHDVEEIDVTMLRRYLDRQAINGKKGGPNRAATMAQKVSVITSFFEWLYLEEYIPRNPAERLRRPKLQPAAVNDNVVTISTREAQLMLDACETWQERLCLHLLVYTGSRRHSAAQLRLRDFDGFATPATLTFRETKGGTDRIVPIPNKLADLIRAAELAGVWKNGDDYLIPPKSLKGWASREEYARRRDDRVIHAIVKDVAEKAGVTCHVHALRAAFATFFADTKPDQSLALQDLMGHKRPETTQVYLRRRDKQRSMAVVADLDWDTFEAIPDTEKEGFEPSFEADGHEGTVRALPADGEA